MSVGLRQALGDVDEVSQRYEDLGLTRSSKLFGREEERAQLLQLLRSEKAERKMASEKDEMVINVCGLAGIGKSYLVKHVALELSADGGSQHLVIYVDASGITKISDMMVKILENPKVNCFASGTKEHLIGLFLHYLRTNKHYKVILIIDDLSTLIDDSSESKEVVKLLQSIVNLKNESGLKIQIVVTSQRKLNASTAGSKTELHREISDANLEIFDLTLNNLDDETSKKFLKHSTSIDADDEQKLKLLTLCKGHPFSLHLLNELYSIDPHILKDLDELLGEEVFDKIDQLFLKAFNRVKQTRVLLAMALFENDAKLEAVFNIIGPGDESAKKFTNKVMEEFQSRFWLSFKSVVVSKQWVRSQRTIVANAYHPAVKRFLRSTVDRYLRDTEHKTDMSKIIEGFIIHHISELTEIGKRCLKNAQLACHNFMHDRANFRTALSEVLRFQSPQLLFNTPHSEMKSAADIIYLFLALHEYHDCFDGQLLKILSTLVQDSNTDNTQSVLIRTLYIIILAAEKAWATLDEVLKTTASKDDPESIKEAHPHLSAFCKGLHGYARSRLYSLSPKYKSKSDAKFIEEQKKVLDDALNSLEALPRALDGPNKYFSIHILMVKAEVTWLANRKDLNSIRTAFRLSKKAEGYTDTVVPILKPIVQLELAEYCVIEGNYHYNIAFPANYREADKLYAESHSYHEKVIREYASRDMKTCTTAAKALMSFCILNQCRGNSLTRVPLSMTEESKKEAVKYYREAAMFAEQAEKAHNILNSTSKLHLAKSMIQKAKSLTPILRVNLNLLDPNSKDYQHYRSILQQSYINAYNLVLTDPTHCDLIHSDPTFKTIRDGISEVMNSLSYSRGEVTKIKKQLEIIANNSKTEKKQNVDRNATLKKEFETEELTAEEEKRENELADSTNDIQLEKETEDDGKRLAGVDVVKKHKTA